MAASERGHVAVVALLLEWKVNVNHRANVSILLNTPCDGLLEETRMR